MAARVQAPAELLPLPRPRCAAKGVEFVQQSAERAYGIEAVMRDNSGNWPVLVETREYTGESFPH